MLFTLIICTYKRSEPLLRLLLSVKQQTLYPSEILIVDGSPDDYTKDMLSHNFFENLTYFKVADNERGLTKQRNYGIAKVQDTSEVVCFLDDDTVLERTYFEEIIKVFSEYNECVGVGGVAVNENRWFVQEKDKNYDNNKYFQMDGYVLKESLRNKIRNYIGLQSDKNPGIMPEYSHGRTCGYPLTGKNHEVDLLIGMSMSFRKQIFDTLRFSTYFEGYGLYEDADFSLRALRFGKNIICTNAKLSHYHDAAGRPNKFDYGKMVVRNGYYVWRIKYPNPSFTAQIKWHLITLLLLIIRFTNVFTTSKRKEALTETLGRISGWFSLFFNSPK